jgi:hypothetical protein
MVTSASFASFMNTTMDKDMLRRLNNEERIEREVTAASLRTVGEQGRPPLAAIRGVPPTSASADTSAGTPQQPPIVSPLFSTTLPLVRQGCTAMVDDSFTRCFKSKKVRRWNWNVYLWPAWVLGVFVRYCILFPLRLLCFVLGFVATAVLFPLVKFLGFFMHSKPLEIA